MDKNMVRSIGIIGVVVVLVVSLLTDANTGLITKLSTTLAVLVGASESYNVYRTYKK